MGVIHHDLGAERALVGCVFVDAGILDEVEIDPDEFYVPAYATVWSVALRLHRQGQPVDLQTVESELRRMGDLDRVDGEAGLLRLTEQVPNIAAAEHYAETIRGHATVRALLKAIGQIRASADAPHEPQTLLDEATRTITAVATDRAAAEQAEPVGDIADRVLEEQHARQSGQSAATRSTGLGGLDRKLGGGFEDADLVIVAGRPGMGKSSLAQAFALHTGQRGEAVAIFSLEMCKEQWTRRKILSLASVDNMRARMGQLNDDELARFKHAGTKLRSLPIHVDDTPRLRPSQVRARARRIRARHGLGMVIVDYVQLLRHHDPNAKEIDVVSEASKEMKALAKELAIPVVALAQLNRDVERRGGDKRPAMSDLRSSGQLEQDADVILLCYREHHYHPTKADPRSAEIIVGKARNATTGSVKATFRGNFFRFEDYQDTEFQDDQKRLGGGKGW